MARFSTLALSLLTLSTLAACSTNSTESKTGNVAASDTAADYDDVEQIPGVSESDDSEVEEVPAADDSAVEEPTCEFEVDTVPNGPVIMQNELVVSFSESNPTDGTTDPGMNQVLDLDLTVVHEDCPALTIYAIQVRACYTDIAGSDWAPSNFQLTNMSEGEAARSTVASSITEAGVYRLAYFGGTSFEIAGGETIGLTFAADSTGASSEDDDMMRVDLPEGGIGVSDGTNIVFIRNPEIQGSTLVF